MKDYFGKELAIGDRVIIIDKNQTGFEEGTIYKMGDIVAHIKFDPPDESGRRPALSEYNRSNARRYPDQIIKTETEVEKAIISCKEIEEMLTVQVVPTNGFVRGPKRRSFKDDVVKKIPLPFDLFSKKDK